MTAPATDAVVLQDVRLDRGGRTILRDLDLRVPAGSITAVLGPSGTGKSTLLAAITGELVPAAGQVRVFDQPVPRGARALLEMRKRIGVLLQGNGLLTDLTVAENVALPLRAHTTLPEPLLHVTAADARELTRAAYHLGNRHVPVQVGEGWLRLAEDSVLHAMLDQLGVSVQALDAPFQPESGAYGGGHHHSHGKDSVFQYAPRLHQFCRDGSPDDSA